MFIFRCTYPTISGSIIQYFDHIGVVFVSGGLKTPLPDLNTATNVGIEVGALEVEESVNNGEIEFQVRLPIVKHDIVTLLF